MRATSRFFVIALLGLGALFPELARADQALRLHETRPGTLNVDGMLRDWRGIRAQRLGVEGQGASMTFALAQDETGLFLGASVEDEQVVTGHDAIVLTLAFPKGGAYRGVEIWVHPGEPGVSASTVSIGEPGRVPKRSRESDAVEAPRGKGPGYLVEAFIPRSALPQGVTLDEARAAIRLRDVDRAARPKVENELASTPVDPRALGRLPAIEPAGGPAALLGQFLIAKGYAGLPPRYDLRGDVTGDARPERLVIVDRYLVVLGSGYREGRAYDYVLLPVASASDVLSAELVDLTGDGKAELVLGLRQRDGRGARDLFSVFRPDEGQVRSIFAVETRKETSAGALEASLRIRPTPRGAPTIEVRAGKATRIDPTQFAESPARDAEPMLLPWGPLSLRAYRWDGQRFAVVQEEKNPNAKTVEPTQAVAPPPNAGPSPRETSPSPSSQDVVAAIRAQRGIAASVPVRFARKVNVAGDATPEHLFVLGAALVVHGPRFRGGEGYVFHELPVSSPEDVLDVTTADFSGNGAEEIVLRIRQRGGDVSRELVFVQALSETNFTRLLAIEIAREFEGRSVQNEIRITTSGTRRVLEVLPGRARGVAAANWPFRDDASGEGIAPLLLPWRDGPRRYGWESGRLQPLR